jgi:hypothetical protein
VIVADEHRSGSRPHNTREHAPNFDLHGVDRAVKQLLVLNESSLLVEQHHREDFIVAAANVVLSRLFRRSIDRTGAFL